MLLFSVLKRYSWLLVLQETVTLTVNLKFDSNLCILDIITMLLFYPSTVS